MTRFEVWIKDQRVISCNSWLEAEHWAGLLGTEHAPASIIHAGQQIGITREATT